MNKIMQGVIRGNTIHLSESPGLTDGEVVQVLVQTLEPPQSAGDGLRRCAGALADHWTEEDDRILQEIHQDRKANTRREIPA